MFPASSIAAEKSDVILIIIRFFMLPGPFYPNPAIKPRSPALWADSSPAEPPGKPKYRKIKWDNKDGEGPERKRD